MIAIDEISGILDHTDACKEQIEMDRNPRVPLCPELRDFALCLLRKSTPLSLLRSECTTWAENRYPGITGNKTHRYRLTTHDSSSLYRTVARECGIPQRSAAEENLNKWFRHDKPQPPSPLLSASCLHYQAHEKPKTERFEIILSTLEMQEAAWKFGHKKQVLMDLTFGICSARALLVILMASNNDGKGIPICFMMFTARETAKATHADYNTALLNRLLGIFKAKMGRNDQNEELDIKVGLTDNDVRERAALSLNWTGTFLLLCIFHIWQAWRNALNRSLRAVSQGDTRQAVRKRLGSLLMSLLKDITSHDEARILYEEEVTYWKRIERKRDPMSKLQGTSALQFLTYLKTYLENEAYWLSWSPAGAIEAAHILQIPVAKVQRTTNALESFNGRIKGKYYKPYQHSGRLPRIDMWILLLVTAVMPDFFKELKERRAVKEYYTALRTLQPLAQQPHELLPPSPSSTSSLDSTPVSALEESIIPDLSPDDDFIKKWIAELEVDDDEATDGDSVWENQYVATLSQKNQQCMELTILIRTDNPRPIDDRLPDDHLPQIRTLDHDRQLNHMDTDDMNSFLSIPESVEEFVGFGKVKFEPGMSKVEVSAYNQH